MRLLGIETSCDETAAAAVEDRRVRSSVVASQMTWHAPHGGVVPELASRRHMETIVPVVRDALRQAEWSWDDVEAVAVTRGPGLVGSLLVGVEFAKGLAEGLGVPLIGVNHVEAHLYAALIEHPDLAFPALGLIVSGGHTELVWWPAPGERPEPIARTRDDAAGEAFDKVAKLLGLPYPGGPEIERLAVSGSEGAADVPRLPKAWMKDGSSDFSFSGLKTAVGRLVAASPDLPVPTVAQAFQEAAVGALVRGAAAAWSKRRPRTVVVTGGVAANGALRGRMEEACRRDGLACVFPSRTWCTDNAAMIALAGSYLATEGRQGREALRLTAFPDLAWDRA